MRITTESVQTTRLRLTLKIDRIWLHRLQIIAFLLIFLYCAVIMLPFTFKGQGSGLDESHNFGTNYFPNMGYRYGLDLVFTYGPLGFLMNPVPLANNILVTNLVRAIVWLILFAFLVRLYRAGARGACQSFVLLAALLTTRNQLVSSFDYYILAAVLVVLVYLIEEPEGWVGYGCVVFLVGLVSLTKFTGYLLSLPAVALFFAARVGWPPKLPVWKDRAAALAILLAAPVSFMLITPSLTAFWKYMKASVQLSSGYSAAMSVATSAQDLIHMFILMGLFFVGLVYAVARRALLWTSAPILAILYWVSLKHGFVRSDTHVVFSYAFEIILAALLICLLKRRRDIAKYAIVFPCFVFVALSGINAWSPLWNVNYWTPIYQRRVAWGLLDWNNTRAQLDSNLKKNDSFVQLPAAFQGLLEGSLTTVFPWELAYAATRHFRLDPLYVIQSYSAYTRYLDEMSAQRIRERYGQVDHILFDWQAIDQRHPLLDVPATWKAMFDCYQPALVGVDQLLLVPRKRPLEHQQTFLRRVPVPFRTWVDLPRTKSVLWSKIHIPYSILGRGQELLFKVPAMWLTAGLESGDRARFRVVPAVLTTAFPLNDMPLDFGSLVAVWQSQRSKARIVRIRLDTKSPRYYQEPSMELFEETQAGVEFVEPIQESFRDIFHLNSPLDIANQAVGFVDLIDSSTISSFPTEVQRLPVGEDGAQFDGWAATDVHGAAFETIYGVVGDRLVRASAVARPDVANYLKNPSLQRSGFHLSLHLSQLGKGKQTLFLVGLTSNSRTYYRIARPLYLKVD